MAKHAPKPRKPPLVRVEWRDATLLGGWHDKDTIKEWVADPVPIVVTVGLMLRDDDECIVLAGSENPDEFGDLNKIPKGMVTRVDILGRRGKREKPA